MLARQRASTSYASQLLRFHHYTTAQIVVAWWHQIVALHGYAVWNIRTGEIMTTRPSPARTAAEIFVHYFRQVAERSGAQWTPQNTRDITDAVRALIDAVQPYAQPIDERDPIQPYRQSAATGTTIKTRRLEEQDPQDRYYERG